MQRAALFCLGILIAAGIVIAEDFWAAKDYMQWTDEEVKKVLTNSPWAKDVTISAPLTVLGRGQRSSESGAATDVESVGGGAARGGRRGASRNGAGSGAEDGSGGNAMVTLNISWRSALPLKKALVRSRLGVSAPVPANAQQLIINSEPDYVIVVSGVPATMAPLFQNSALADKSTIRAGKKAPVAARGVNVQPRTQSVDVIYLFPRTQPIETEDKEVEVVLKLGAMEAKKKFNLKEMVYNGKLEL